MFGERLKLMAVGKPHPSASVSPGDVIRGPPGLALCQRQQVIATPEISLRIDFLLATLNKKCILIGPLHIRCFYPSRWGPPRVLG